MTQAVLNTQLYQKMFAEQEQFKEELMQLPPGEILQKAYEYVCREDILLSLEYNDLSPKQAKALLKSPTPLADVFKKWDSWEGNHHMENIWNAVEAHANEVVKWYGLFFCPEGCKVIRSAIHPTGNQRKSAAGGLADLSESL